MGLDYSKASPEEISDEIWEVLGVDPVRRDLVVRCLEKKRAATEQTARAKGTREERFVARLLDFASERGKDSQGYRYFLIWYAKTHGERGAGLRRGGRPSSKGPNPASKIVAQLLRAHMERHGLAKELSFVDEALRLGWDSINNYRSIKQMAKDWRIQFKNKLTTLGEQEEYEGLIKSVFPPIPLGQAPWRQRHEDATSCLAQGLLVGMGMLVAQPCNPDTFEDEPPSSVGANFGGSRDQSSIPGEMVGMEDPSAPVDDDDEALDETTDDEPQEQAPPDGRQLCDDAPGTLPLQAEYLDWDSNPTSFCGAFGAVFRPRIPGASTSSLPNGRIELCVPDQPVTLYDIIPPAQAPKCSDGGSYALPALAVISKDVILTGKPWKGRAFVAGRQMYDSSMAQLVVHVLGTPRAVTIGTTHGPPQALNGTIWHAGNVGEAVFFPDVDPRGGETALTIEGGAVGPTRIPLIAGTMTNVSVVPSGQ